MIPNLLVIGIGKEIFPFSNNPMFGHYVTTDDTIASITFTVREEDNWRTFSLREVGLWEIRTLRYYFSNVYGSSEANSPQSVPFSKEKFIEENTRFFTELDRLMKLKTISYDSISIHLNFLDQNDELTKNTLIGTYVENSKKFYLANEF